jgi:hypothetical protein
MTDLVEPRAASIAPRVAAWAVLGLVVYVLVGFGSLLLVATVERVVLDPLGLGGEPGTSSWGWVLASHPIAWGVIVAAVAAWLGGRLLPGAVRAGPSSAAHLGTGLALAAVTTYLLHEFVRARYGWSDPEYYGLAIFAPSALVAIGLAGWAAAAIGRERRGPLIVAQMGAVAALAIALLPSLPGIQDGIQASSIPLAAVFVLDAGFAFVSVVTSVLPTGAKAAREG